MKLIRNFATLVQSQNRVLLLRNFLRRKRQQRILTTAVKSARKYGYRPVVITPAGAFVDYEGVLLGMDLVRNDPAIHGLQYQNAYFETETEKFIVSALAERGGAFWDIGANIGLFSLLAAQRCPKLVIYSVEASPYTYKRLVGNVEANHLNDRIRPLNCALWEREEMISITEQATVCTHILPSPLSEGIRIPGRTLDCLVREFCAQTISVLKADIEGAEMCMLRGGLEVLRQHRPLLILELEDRYLERFGDTSENVVRLLSDQGYQRSPSLVGGNHVFAPM